jgi:hypothetical protein
MVALAAGGMLLASCSRWNGEEIYRPAGKHRRLQAAFAVGLPGQDWSPLGDRGDGFQVAWRHNRSSSVIQVRSQCEEHGDSSLESFTQHLAIDFDQWELSEREGADKAQTEMRLIGRAALRSHVHAQLDGVDVELEVLVVKKDGCLFDLSFVAVPEHFQQDLPTFERVVSGFRFPLDAGKRKS